MEFRVYSEQTPLVTNAFGIAEPSTDAPQPRGVAIRMMLLPLVGFDEVGNRLGMGGGYYDRYLSNLPESLRPLLIGVAHECQLCAELTPEPWDVPLDGLLTESRWQWFNKHRR